jgi:dihydrofolate reductase
MAAPAAKRDRAFPPLTIQRLPGRWSTVREAIGPQWSLESASGGGLRSRQQHPDAGDVTFTPPMARIIVTEFISLDGVVEGPGGSEDFKYGGWSFEIERGAEGDMFKLDETMDSDALLLGRVTYEGFAVAWPSRDGEFADRFNSMPKHVVSSTLQEPGWNNSTVLKGDVVQEVSKLRQEQDGNIVVHGSAQLVQTLLEHDLVDELRLMVFPVVLGAGKRLFGDTSDKKRLRLTDSKRVGDGVDILIYEPAGKEAAS